MCTQQGENVLMVLQLLSAWHVSTVERQTLHEGSRHHLGKQVGDKVALYLR